MSYTITKTNGATVATVIDGTVDSTSSSLTLIGKNYAGYGVFLNDNFVKLLENFSNGTAPLAPLNGQLWFDSSNRMLNVYDAAITTWKTISTSSVSATQPTNPITGDLWWDITNNQLKAYGNSTWVLVGPTYTSATGKSGAIVETIIDTIGSSHVVIKFYVTSGGSTAVVAIVSKDLVFTPQTTISGFTTISPGINLISSSTITDAAFHGDVTNALAVGGIVATKLLRNDQSGTISGSLIVNDNNGLTIGGSTNFNIGVDSLNQSVNLTNQIGSADVNFYVTPVGQPATKVLSLLGSTGQVNLPNAIASTSTTTGALTVAGGVGIAGALNVAGATTVQSVTQSTSTTTGALIVSGGTGIAGALNVGTTANIAGSLNVSGNANIKSGVDSTSTTTGAATIYGGLGVTGNINAGNVNATYIYGNIIGTVSSVITSVGTLSNLSVTGTVQLTNGMLYCNAGIASTTTSTGTVIIGNTAGGLGVAGNINAGGNVTAVGNVNASNARITNNLTSSALYIGNIQATANNVSNIGSATSGFNYFYVGNIMPMQNSVGNIGSSSAYYNRVFATSTSALYSDLAERFEADAVYEPGTVVEIGGLKEITIAVDDLSDKVFGVISTDPAYTMNNGSGNNDTHPAVALQGRVPVKVIGTVAKGDRLVSAGNGKARVGLVHEVTPFNVIGRSLVDKTTIGEELIMAVVKAIS